MKTEIASKRVLVMGLGNILLKDEGVGVHIAAELQKQTLAGNVEVIDGGTAGLDALLLAKDIDKLVIIDALRAGKEPGTIYKASFNGSDKKKLSEIFSRDNRSNISLHQVNLIEGLGIAERLGQLPEEIVIIGVEPKEIDCGLELTEPVKEKLEQIVKTVLEEI